MIHNPFFENTHNFFKLCSDTDTFSFKSNINSLFHAICKVLYNRISFIPSRLLMNHFHFYIENSLSFGLMKKEIQKQLINKTIIAC